jgi:hypothetical protein
MAVNTQTLTLTAGGALALTGSPTGSGVYAVNTFGAASSQVLSSITGGSGSAVITLHPVTAGQYFRVNNGATFLLRQQLDFVPASINDRITLRLNEAGTAWLEEIPRGAF